MGILKHLPIVGILYVVSDSCRVQSGLSPKQQSKVVMMSELRTRVSTRKRYYFKNQKDVMTGRYFDVVFLRFIDHRFVLEHPYDVILTFIFSRSIWSYILTSK